VNLNLQYITQLNNGNTQMYLTIKQYKHNYKEDKTENTHACAHSQKTTTNKQTNKKNQDITHQMYRTQTIYHIKSI
jgi:hypothetical protein